MGISAKSPPKKANGFKTEIKPDWCPGCGDFGLLTALQRACVELELHPHEIMLVSGIGCSSNLPGFFHSYGAHTLHGRALPFATGCKLANHGMTVIAVGGDGDGYGIGLNHFVQAIRRNINIAYLVMNNEIYGLTTGQVSPTSEKGMKTKSTPEGNLELPVNPLMIAFASNCGYVARGFSGEPKHLVKLIADAVRFPGFALVDVFSPCVTFNKLNTYNWFRGRIYTLEDEKHDPTDLDSALKVARKWGDEIPIGLLYKDPQPRPSLDHLDPALEGDKPLVEQPYTISKKKRRDLINEYM